MIEFRRVGWNSEVLMKVEIKQFFEDNILFWILWVEIEGGIIIESLYNGTGGTLQHLVHCIAFGLIPIEVDSSVETSEAFRLQ